MQLVTIDFETYFADDYTLQKMTTEAYVRDPRFKVHCVATKMDGNEACAWDGIAGQGWNGPTKVAMLAHHAHFDGLILSHHFNIRPAFWFDTLSMSRLVFPQARSHSLESLARMLGVGEKSISYASFKNVRDLPPALEKQVQDGACADVELTHKIFKALLPYVPKDELRQIDMTVRLFTEPALRLDRALLQQYLIDHKVSRDALLAEVGVTPKDLRSADKFADLLRRLGVDPPTKPSPKTGKEIYAFAKTDEAMRELEDHEDDTVAALVEARLNIKSNMVETRAERLLSMDTRGAMCVYLNYAGAHTLRFSGGDKLNWQNFKRKAVIREAILAPEGYMVVVVDASQIECRLLLWFAGQWDILQLFKEGRDVYSEIATEFYQEPVDKTKPDKRGMGKQIILSCGYGAGGPTIQKTARLGTYGPPVQLTDEEALAARDLYRRTHPQVKKLWKTAKGVLEYLCSKNPAPVAWGPMQVHSGCIFLPNGTFLDYRSLRFNGEEYYLETRKGRARIYGAKLVENVIQALARVVLCEAMLKISARYKIVVHLHDEIVYLARTEEAEEALKFGLATMKTPPAWCANIPLEAEGGYGVRYSK